MASVPVWRGRDGRLAPEDRTRVDAAIDVSENLGAVIGDVEAARDVAGEHAEDAGASADLALDAVVITRAQADAAEASAIDADLRAAAASTAAGAAEMQRLATLAIRNETAMLAAAGASAASFYDTIALGRAAVTNAQSFGVRAGGTDNLLRPTIYRRDSATTQTLLVELADSAEVVSLSGRVQGLDRTATQVTQRTSAIHGDATSRTELEDFSVMDDLRQVLLGLDKEDWIWLFGLGIRLGLDGADLQAEDRKFLWSIDDDPVDPYSYFAVTKPNAEGQVGLYLNGETYYELGGGAQDPSIGEIGYHVAERVAYFPAPADPSVLTTATENWLTVQVPNQTTVYATTGANRKIDLSDMLNGSILHVFANHPGCKVWAGTAIDALGTITPRSFFGRPENMVTLAANDAVQIINVNGSRRVIVVAGAPVFTSEVAPIMDKSILLAGQSNCANWAMMGGIGGFAQALRSSTWMGSDATRDLSSFFFMQGATGETALFKSLRNTDRHWINDDDPNNWTPGVAMLKALTAITTGVALGQPAPEFIKWDKDEAETGFLEDGSLTLARCKTGLLWVLTELRNACIAAGAVNPQVAINVLGSYDQQLSRRRRGGTASRQASLEVAAETAWIHIGANKYDLPRPPGDIHLNANGYHQLGWRDAREYANIMLGRTLSTGPRLASVANEGGGVFLATFASTGGLVMPRGDISQAAAKGPFPFGFLLVPAGQDATAEPVPILRADVINSTQIRFTTALADAAGCRLAFPAGYYPEAMAFAFPRDSQGPAPLPGMPLRPFISTPI